jgi:ubiquinone/menaquinone biosynthesis C-methylase UbiE
MSSRWRQLMKQFHPEGIPWPASLLYNALASTRVFLQQYELVADDIARYGAAECILDIGTGPGNLLLAVRKVFPDAHLVGIDISPAMVAQAQRNMEKQGANSHIEVKIAGANALPFADGTFNRVVSTLSFHHWKNPVQALSEAYRVLKPGSYALLYDFVRDMPLAAREQVWTQFGGFLRTLLRLRSLEEPFLNAEEMETLGRRTDFMVEGTRFTGALCCLILRKTAISAKNQT